MRGGREGEGGEREIEKGRETETDRQKQTGWHTDGGIGGGGHGERASEREREGERERGYKLCSILALIGACAALFVTGSHVTARVTVQDIWCSNGVIFIIDEILHLPTRTIAEELKRRPELKYDR